MRAAIDEELVEEREGKTEMAYVCDPGRRNEESGSVTSVAETRRHVILITCAHLELNDPKLQLRTAE